MAELRHRRSKASWLVAVNGNAISRFIAAIAFLAATAFAIGQL